MMCIIVHSLIYRALNQGPEDLTPPSHILKHSLTNRAPELLLGLDEYRSSIDIWSLGCIFAEVTTCGDKLFQDIHPEHPDEYVSQLFTIFRILGTPSLSQRSMLGVDECMDMNNRPRFAKVTAEELMVQVPGLTLQEAHLLQDMLRYIPETRPTASMLLEHEFFQQLNPR